MASRDSQIGDHVHDLAYTQDGKLEPISMFDFNEIDRNLGLLEPDQPEEMISFSDAAACWALLIEWITGSHQESNTFNMAGARAHSLMYWLGSSQCHFGSLEAIAVKAGCSKAALSKSLLKLRDQLSIGFQFKKMGSRQANRESQIRALEQGKHSSQIKRQKQNASVSCNSEFTNECSRTCYSVNVKRY